MNYGVIVKYKLRSTKCRINCAVLLRLLKQVQPRVGAMEQKESAYRICAGIVHGTGHCRETTCDCEARSSEGQ